MASRTVTITEPPKPPLEENTIEYDTNPEEVEKLKETIEQCHHDLETIMYAQKYKRPELDVPAFMETIRTQAVNLVNFVEEFRKHAPHDKKRVLGVVESPLSNLNAEERALRNKVSEAFTNAFTVGELRLHQIRTCRPEKTWVPWKYATGFKRIHPPGQDHVNMRFCIRSPIRVMERSSYVSAADLKAFEADYERVKMERKESSSQATIGPKYTDEEDEFRLQRKASAKPLQTMEDYDKDLHVRRHGIIKKLHKLTDEVVNSPMLGPAFKAAAPIIAEEIHESLNRYDTGDLSSADHEAYTGIPRAEFEALGVRKATSDEDKKDKDTDFFHALFVGPPITADSAKKKKKKADDDPPEKEVGCLQFTSGVLFNTLRVLLIMGAGIGTALLMKMFSTSWYENEMKNLVEKNRPMIKAAFKPVVTASNELIQDHTAQLDMAAQWIHARNNSTAPLDLHSPFVKDVNFVSNVTMTTDSAYTNYPDFCAAANDLAKNPGSPFYSMIGKIKSMHFLSFMKNKIALMPGADTAEPSFWEREMNNMTKIDGYMNDFEGSFGHVYNIRPKDFCPDPTNTILYPLGAQDPKFIQASEELRKEFINKVHGIMASKDTGIFLGEMKDRIDGVVKLYPDDMKLLDEFGANQQKLLANLMTLRDEFQKTPDKITDKLIDELVAGLVKWSSEHGVDNVQAMAHEAIGHVLTPSIDPNLPPAVQAQLRADYAKLTNAMVSSFLSPYFLKMKQVTDIMELLPAIFRSLFTDTKQLYTTSFHGTWATMFSLQIVHSLYQGQLTMGLDGFASLFGWASSVVAFADTATGGRLFGFASYGPNIRDLEERAKMERESKMNLFRWLLKSDPPDDNDNNQDKASKGVLSKEELNRTIKDDKANIESLNLLQSFLTTLTGEKYGPIYQPMTNVTKWEYFVNNYENPSPATIKKRRNQEAWLKTQFDNFPATIAPTSRQIDAQINQYHESIKWKDRLKELSDTFDRKNKHDQKLQEELKQAEEAENKARRWHKLTMFAKFIPYGYTAYNIFSPILGYVFDGVISSDIFSMILHKGLFMATGALFAMVGSHFLRKGLKNRLSEEDKAKAEEQEKMEEITDEYFSQTTFFHWINSRNLTNFVFHATLTVPITYYAASWSMNFISSAVAMHAQAVDLATNATQESLINVTNSTAAPLAAINNLDPTSFLHSENPTLRMLQLKPLEGYLFAAIRNAARKNAKLFPYISLWNSTYNSIFKKIMSTVLRFAQSSQV